MNKTIQIITSVVTIVLVIVVGYILVSNKGNRVGAVPSPQTSFSHFSGTIYAGGDIVEGGGSFATSSANGTFPNVLGTDQLTDTEFLPANLIYYTPNTASTTLTLPSSFSNTLQNVGDSVTSFIQNSTSTALVNVILAAPAISVAPNTTITMATTSLTLHPGEIGKLECMRWSTATTTCIVY